MMVMRGHVVGEISSCRLLRGVVVELLGADGEISQWGLWYTHRLVCFKGSWLHDPSFNFHSAKLTNLMAFHECWWLR